MSVMTTVAEGDICHTRAERVRMNITLELFMFDVLDVSSRIVSARYLNES